MGYLVFFLCLLATPAYADPVSIVVAAAVGAANAAIAGTAIVAGALISGTLAVVGQLLTPKPKGANNSFAKVRSNGSTQQIRQPITTRDIVYGEIRKSGPVVFAAVTEENKYVHLAIALCSHESQEIGEILINDLSVPLDDLDADGFVQSGRYANLMRVKKHLGVSDQTADTTMVSEIPEWTTDHRLRGITYVYIRYEWDRDVFISGIPNTSFWVKGVKVTDPRDDSQKWTPNIALQVNDYLTNSFYGLGASNIDQDELIGATNTCDEFVSTALVNHNYTNVGDDDIITVSGDRLKFQLGDRVTLLTGSIQGLTVGQDYYVIPYQRKDTARLRLATTLQNAIDGISASVGPAFTSGVLRKNAEPRYHGGGLLEVISNRGVNLQEILTGMAGQAVYAGGKWRILAGEYNTPTIAFDKSDLAGPISVQTKVSKSERFNQVQGVYVSPLNDGNPADYPLVKNTTYVTLDGKDLKRDLDLPFTQRASTAQRIAKLQMERMRQEIVFTCRFKIIGMKVQVGDNFFFTFERYGWTDKVFEVISWSLDNDGTTAFVEMTCRENASAVYDWNNGEETTVDPAPNSSLPNPFIISVVGGFSLDSVLVNTQSTDKIFKVEASWELHPDFYVSSGGRYEIEFKKSTDPDTAYRSAAKVDGRVTQQEILGLQPDTEYDIRIYAFNYIGVRSAVSIIEGFVVGNTITTNTEDWESETLARSGDDWENDTLTSEDWEA